MEPPHHRPHPGEGSPLDPGYPPVAAAAGDDDADGHALHICPECSSCLVYPTDWVPAYTCHWRMELRCPECECRQVGLFAQTALERFDHILDQGTEAMIADLRAFQRSNMEHELERFTTALRQDLILPEDF